MKTKVNKVPLVGPRGRRELLDRIEELERKVNELEESKEEKHTIKILNSGEILSTEAALSLLELDGKTPTLDELLQLDWNNTLVYYPAFGIMCPTYWDTRETLYVYGGAKLGDAEDSFRFCIAPESENGCVIAIYEL